MLLYALIAVGVVFTVCILLQIVYIRVSISKFQSQDYYKQALVNNDLDLTGMDRVNGMNIYSLQVIQDLSMMLNTTSVQQYLSDQAVLPDMTLPIMYAGSLHSASFKPSSFSFLVLKKTASSEKLVEDITNNKVNYLTFSGLTCPVLASLRISEAVMKYFTSEISSPDVKERLDVCKIIVCIQPPTYNELIPAGYAPDPNARFNIISFTGSTLSQSVEELTMRIKETTITHALGYRI
jgi:hypothetical protein